MTKSHSSIRQQNFGFPKRCFVCGETKELVAFMSDTSRREGLAYRCKPCHVNEGREYAANNPEKIACRKLLAEAIKSGVLTRQPCQVCGEPDAQGHHEDYSKPLSVWWLCSEHHGERHREINKELRSSHTSY